MSPMIIEMGILWLILGPFLAIVVFLPDRKMVNTTAIFCAIVGGLMVIVGMAIKESHRDKKEK